MVVDLYNELYKLLTNDDQLLAFLSIPQDDEVSKTQQIIKRRTTNDLSSLSKPLLSFYATSGKRHAAPSSLHDSFFRFDVITLDDVELAHKIGSYLYRKFEGCSFTTNGLESLDSVVHSQQETDTDLASAYCFTLVVRFRYVIDNSTC
ncbi:hypothetical protein BRE01_17800 [Brevibacillus reuszeri]|uniref:Uncharacterized protein n=1 Tax=Brevibacillus reuszeri TaxID=54915 RepID=A0A0K9Z044_9BACL|nr:hypothetical protein [Brevibacillus reuszeri]KNB74334.1 hypothetical protein ADS79_01105 [Brevibacillus reuszeri]MED1856233.1 hypothetical protein [Brevibacillus reuszeri]GED68078.1 hypothetical protein BRE01_17800 [Brevibacillus reuszeri]